MVQVNNREVLKRIEREAFIQVGREAVPSQLNASIQPVLISNPYPYVDIVKFKTQNANGSSQVYTARADKRFYMTNISLVINNNGVASDSYVTGVIDGATITLIRLSGDGFVPVNQVISFSTPVKFDMNTNITITSITGGVPSVTCIMYGYLLDED